MLHTSGTTDFDEHPRAIKPPAELDDGSPVDLPVGFAPYLIGKGDFAATARAVIADAAVPLVRAAIRLASGVEEARGRRSRPAPRPSDHAAEYYKLRVEHRSLPSQWLIAVSFWRERLKHLRRVYAFQKNKPVVKRLDALLRCEPPGMEPVARLEGRPGRHCGLTSCCLFCHARAAGEATVALARAANRRPVPDHPVRFVVRKVALTSRALPRKTAARLAARLRVAPQLVGASDEPDPAAEEYAAGLWLARRVWGRAVPVAERDKLEAPVQHLLVSPKRRGRQIRDRAQFLKKALDPKTTLSEFRAAGGVLCRKPLTNTGFGTLLLLTDQTVRRAELVPSDGAGFWLAPRVARALRYPAAWLTGFMMFRRVDRSLKSVRVFGHASRAPTTRSRVREYATYGLCRVSGTKSGPRALGYQTKTAGAQAHEVDYEQSQTHGAVGCDILPTAASARSGRTVPSSLSPIPPEKA